MVDITLKIPTQYVQRVLDGMCGQFGYQEEVSDPNKEGGMITNPESKQAFAKRMIIEGVKNAVRSWEANQASEEARLLALADVNNIEVN